MKDVPESQKSRSSQNSDTTQDYLVHKMHSLCIALFLHLDLALNNSGRCTLLVTEDLMSR